MGLMAVPHVAASAASVRRRLAAELGERGLGVDVVGDAALVASELVTNALRHARPLPGHDVVEVGWETQGDCLVVSVTDGGSETEPTPLPPSPGALGGRGLAIVTALAADWGYRRNNDTTSTVWASLPLHAVAH